MMLIDLQNAWKMQQKKLKKKKKDLNIEWPFYKIKHMNVFKKLLSIKNHLMIVKKKLRVMLADILKNFQLTSENDL